jgi:hypothetical protein
MPGKRRHILRLAKDDARACAGRLREEADLALAGDEDVRAVVAML